MPSIPYKKAGALQVAPASVYLRPGKKAFRQFSLYAVLKAIVKLWCDSEHFSMHRSKCSAYKLASTTPTAPRCALSEKYAVVAWTRASFG
eukprot:78727-Pleurochrysis_carterae.AAC.1